MSITTDKQKISEEVNKLITRLVIKYPKYKILINYELLPTKNNKTKR